MLVPEWVVAAAYLIVAVLAALTAQRDSGAMIPARIFLALACLSWVGFYVATDVLGPAAAESPARDVLRVLSRWMHLATSTAIGLVVWGRWYLHRKLQ